MRSYKIYAMPIDQPAWMPKGDGNVTLIGDAAHVMSPFAGEGVNLALLDACKLGKVIVEGGQLVDAFSMFDKEMLERARKEARKSQHHLDVLYGPDAAKNMAEIMRGYFTRGPPSD